MTVAAPVSEVRATSFVGFASVPVKYPVSHRMMPASTMPMTTAPTATQPRAAAERLDVGGPRR